MPASATVLLARHGLTEVTGSVLVGRTPGIGLDERGRTQARDLGRRLGALPLDAVVTSPLERCAQTAQAVAEANTATPAVRAEERLLECDYGQWTGRELKGLAEEPLWPTVQAHPSAVRFPGGESMAEAARRAVAAVRDLNTELGAQHEHPVYLVCSHADIIKAVLADALGLHLDLFQRLQIDPCSVSVVRYTPMRPFVERLNDTGGGTAGLRADDETDSGEAVVGGGAGAGASPPQPPIA
jgi:probable phosphomutase (TIGR03848 family)